MSLKDIIPLFDLSPGARADLIQTATLIPMLFTDPDGLIELCRRMNALALTPAEPSIKEVSERFLAKPDIPESLRNAKQKVDATEEVVMAVVRRDGALALETDREQESVVARLTPDGIRLWKSHRGFNPDLPVEPMDCGNPERVVFVQWPEKDGLVDPDPNIEARAREVAQAYPTLMTPHLPGFRVVECWRSGCKALMWIPDTSTGDRFQCWEHLAQSSRRQRIALISDRLRDVGIWLKQKGRAVE